MFFSLIMFKILMIFIVSLIASNQFYRDVIKIMGYFVFHCFVTIVLGWVFGLFLVARCWLVVVDLIKDL
jgi:hypothetical protein